MIAENNGKEITAGPASNDAFTQLQKNAREGKPEAMEKLAGMYLDGNGVEQNLEAAAEWLEKLGSYWEPKFYGTGQEEAGDHCFSALWDLCTARKNLKQYDSARNVSERLIRITKFQRARFGNDTAWERIGLMYLTQGSLYEGDSKWDAARDCYEKAIPEFIYLYEKNAGKHDRDNLIMNYEFFRDLCKKEEKKEETVAWIERIIALREQPLEESMDISEWKALGSSYLKLGIALRALDKNEEACQAYQTAIEWYEYLYTQKNQKSARVDLSSTYNNMGNTCRDMEKYADARSWYEKSVQLRQERYEEEKSEKAKKALIKTYQSFVKLCNLEGKEKEAQEWESKITMITQ